MSKRKAYWDMTPEELAAATKEFDDPNYNPPVVKPSAAQKGQLRLWQRKARQRTKRNEPLPTPEVDRRSAERRAKDERIAAQSPLSPSKLPPETPLLPVEAHLERNRRQPVVVTGVVENGLVRPLDPASEPEVLRNIGEESRRRGTDKLTSRQIDRIITAARRAKPRRS